MLQKKYRLKKYSVFIATYHVNDTVSDDKICVYFGRQKKDMSIPTKFAFVVSKKVSKRAVVRNRIKRLMRESCRLLIKNSQINNIYNYMSVVFVAKPSCVNIDFESVNSSIVSLLNNK